VAALRARHLHGRADWVEKELPALIDTARNASLLPDNVAATANAARQAIGWFLGDNDIGAAMWDPATGGGYDGLTLHGPSLNQGVESTLALISTMQHTRSLP